MQLIFRKGWQRDWQREDRKDNTLGPGIVFLIPLYFILVSLLGYVVLRFVERGDRTFTNVGIFVVGATLGMFGLVNFAFRILFRILNPYDYLPTREVVGWRQGILAFSGLLLGGILAVRLKNRVCGAPHSATSGKAL